ncbi:MAG: hypothetical protein IJZ16_03685 [Clostridia bacterium]|nr:hypothetical protein [Clostridia bacterium]
MALFAILMCVNFASCSNEENDIPQKGKEVIVSLGFGGDFEISESPLSRATSNDLYFIQVGQGSSSTDATICAYGLFDSSTDIKIKLVENEAYYFHAYVMKGAKEVLKHTNYIYQDEPFLFDVELNNTFTYSDDESFAATEKETSQFGYKFTYTDGSAYHFAKDIDLYFTENVNPFTATDNGKITLNLIRFSYGANFIAENLTEGSLKISMQKKLEGNTEIYISPTIELTESNTSSDNIYAIPPTSVMEVNEDNEFVVNMPISFTWVKSDNSEILLGTPTITLKRNKKVTVKIKVDKTLENGIEFAYAEDLTMGDGGTYNVDGDNATEVTE